MSNSIPATHFCRQCQAEKPLSEFWRQSRNKSGVQSPCKECRRRKVQGLPPVVQSLPERYCPKCATKRPIAEFARRDRPTGYGVICNLCERDRVRAERRAKYYRDVAAGKPTARNPVANRAASRRDYERNREKRQDRRHLWAESNRDKLREYNEARKSSPEERARKKLRDWVAHGRIVKPKNCQWCGAECLLEGHHEDYGRPLDVIWLCRKCHGLTRRKDGADTA